jgi:mannitol/fructose-specific phosphotransferase system IIA component
LVFGLGASSSIEHVTVLQKLMALLSDQENVEKLLTAQSYEEIKPLLGGQE